MSDERIFDHQDWKTIVVKTNKKKDENKKPSKKLDNTTQKLMKVERKADNDELKHDVYTKEFRIAMVHKRTKTLNMTQKQLEQLVVEIRHSDSISNDYEIRKYDDRLAVETLEGSGENTAFSLLFKN